MTTRVPESKVCCEKMAAHINWNCPDHAHAEDCPDALIGRLRSGAYGLFVHDGGSSYLEIKYCPWCGSSTPRAGSGYPISDGGMRNTAMEYISRDQT